MIPKVTAKWSKTTPLGSNRPLKTCGIYRVGATSDASGDRRKPNFCSCCVPGTHFCFQTHDSYPFSVELDAPGGPGEGPRTTFWQLFSLLSPLVSEGGPGSPKWLAKRSPGAPKIHLNDTKTNPQRYQTKGMFRTLTHIYLYIYVDNTRILHIIQETFEYM